MPLSVESDSVCAVNPCSVGNGGCAHDCIFTHITHYCKCRPGYRLMEDGKQCEGKISPSLSVE